MCWVSAEPAEIDWGGQWSDTGLVTTGSVLHLSSCSEPTEQPEVVCNVCSSLADRAQDLQDTCALLEEHPDSEEKARTNTKRPSVGKSQVPHCQLPPKAPQITDRKCSPASLLTTSMYLTKSASRSSSPFIIMPLFMFVQVLIIPSCKGLMHLQKHAFVSYIFRTPLVLPGTGVVPEVPKK